MKRVVHVVLTAGQVVEVEDPKEPGDFNMIVRQVMPVRFETFSMSFTHKEDEAALSEDEAAAMQEVCVEALVMALQRKLESDRKHVDRMIVAQAPKGRA